MELLQENQGQKCERGMARSGCAWLVAREAASGIGQYLQSPYIFQLAFPNLTEAVPANAPGEYG